jgi:inorganic pyrophosphatase
MGRERAIDFGDHGVRESGPADVDHRLERVRAAFQVGPLTRRQRNGHPLIVVLARQSRPSARVLHQFSGVTDLTRLPSFTKYGTVHCVVESPRGSVCKLKYDPGLGAIALARPLVLGLAYPFDWGFIPSTEGPDGDPVDAFIMWDGTSYPGTVVECRPIGVLRVEQNEEDSGGRQRNDRVALLPEKALRCEDIRSVNNLSAREREELERFFLAAVAFQNKNLKILGWGGPQAAATLVRDSQKRKRKRGKKR